MVAFSFSYNWLRRRKNMDYKNKLIELASTKARSIYGDILDERIENRIYYEIEELSRCCDLKTIYEIYLFIETQKKAENLYLSRLCCSNSLVFYLIGLGNVNPLPRHTYCPACHTFHWGCKQSDVCENCGDKPKVDGYDLPFEILIDNISKHGLKLCYSSLSCYNHDKLAIKYYENDLLKLAKLLGFSQTDIDENNLEFFSTLEILDCLHSNKVSNNGLDYFSSKYKKTFIFNHPPFIGIQDLSSPVLKRLLRYWNTIFDFDDLVKVTNMLHGSGVADANIKFITKKNSTYADIKDCITSRDELYYLLKSFQLNEDDALLIIRETRLCGNGHLSKFSEYKLIEANVETRYINFMKCLSYIFDKGHTVGHMRLAIKIAKIYLEDPLRYFKAYFTINKDKLLKMDKDYDFIKGISKYKSTELEEIYLATIDLLERGFDPLSLIQNVLG